MISIHSVSCLHSIISLETFQTVVYSDNPPFASDHIAVRLSANCRPVCYWIAYLRITGHFLITKSSDLILILIPLLPYSFEALNCPIIAYHPFPLNGSCLLLSGFTCFPQPLNVGYYSELVPRPPPLFLDFLGFISVMTIHLSLFEHPPHIVFLALMCSWAADLHFLLLLDLTFMNDILLASTAQPSC